MPAMSGQMIEGLMVLCSLFMILLPFFILLLVFIVPMCPRAVCDDYWKTLPYVILKILAIPAFFGGIALIVLFKQAREYFLDNFDQFKCKPWFMPFVSFVRADVSASDNFQKCMGESCSGVFAAMTTPFLGMSESLGQGMNIASSNFEQVQRNHLNMGNDMVHVIAKTTNEMGRMQAMTTYMYLKMKAIFDKMLATIFDLYFAMITMLDMVNIMILTPQYFILGLFVIFITFFTLYIVTLIICIYMLAVAMFQNSIPIFGVALAAGTLTARQKLVLYANAVFFMAWVPALVLYEILNKMDKSAQRAMEKLQQENRVEFLQNQATLKQGVNRNLTASTV